MRTDPLIDRILRVNHAGESAAVYIYRGQLRGLQNNLEKRELIYEMMKTEQKHLQFFHSQIVQLRARPTILLGLCKGIAFGVGYLGAKAGVQVAMSCTTAIEDTIDRHYQKQIKFLSKAKPHEHQLLNKIVQFRQEELEHKDIGLANEANKAPFHSIITKVVGLGCTLGIFIAEKF
ncbi:demethoxyubiquinone hydroxylase family protein [Neorickettsia sp. 179522]|uniref:demethoxyubiquinone hydroxylase family protein n=1 Tax=Neorickettsia sp. 179522 TaxID=1714371 RepID=UPI000791317D|nr:demethoxyubiquinone hydroxylase family protein [Neorickettsia sp. 179522]KYH12442.1 conjugal transfer protein [Neorickettsia sp. 179522]